VGRVASHLRAPARKVIRPPSKCSLRKTPVRYSTVGAGSRGGDAYARRSPRKFAVADGAATVPHRRRPTTCGWAGRPPPRVAAKPLEPRNRCEVSHRRKKRTSLLKHGRRGSPWLDPTGLVRYVTRVQTTVSSVSPKPRILSPAPEYERASGVSVPKYGAGTISRVLSVERVPADAMFARQPCDAIRLAGIDGARTDARRGRHEWAEFGRC
jgi:hypothetical protein